MEKATPFDKRRAGAWIPALLLLACGLAAPAAAGSLYRCNGAHGEIAYTNHTGDYPHCTRVAHYAESARAAATPAPAGRWVYREQRAKDAAAPAPGSAPVAVSAHGDSHGTRVLKGAVYRVKRHDNIVEYTNVRPHGAAARQYQTLFTYIATCRACDVHSAIDWSTTPLNLAAYQHEIRQASLNFGVDPSLLRALIHAESAFDPDALSVKGAQGLMQLMPATASDLGVTNPFNVAQNIRGGARYLAQLLKDFNGDERLATAAYNAGENAVKRYDGVPPYAETQVYVKRVGLLHKRYRQALGAASQLADSSGSGSATASGAAR